MFRSLDCFSCFGLVSLLYLGEQSPIRFLVEEIVSIEEFASSLGQLEESIRLTALVVLLVM